jgi:hypothetical protein
MARRPQTQNQSLLGLALPGEEGAAAALLHLANTPHTLSLKAKARNRVALNAQPMSSLLLAPVLDALYDGE